jgi:ankyrin repeat protein
MRLLPLSIPPEIEEQIFLYLDSDNINKLGNSVLESVRMKKKDKTPINAIQNNNMAALKYLVECCNANGDEALILSAHKGKLEFVTYLVEHGVNIHTDDDNALIEAAFHGHLDVVEFLVENGAAVNTRNDSALEYSAGRGHLDIVKYLVRNNAGHFLQALVNGAYKGCNC